MAASPPSGLYQLLSHFLISVPEPFEDEIHPRLRYSHRGLVGMANSGAKDSNDSQFFITLGISRAMKDRTTTLTDWSQTGRTSYTAKTPCLDDVWETHYLVRTREFSAFLMILNDVKDVLKIGEMGANFHG